MVHSGTDVRNSDIGAKSDFSDDDEEIGVEQLSGCRIPGCQCDGRIAFMEWGSEDMTETDDSEYEGSIDRANRLYVESYNYDLSEGMTPKTYNPPLRRNRRRRYEVRIKNEVDVEESITVTSDRVFQADKESPKLEPTVQPRTVADDDIPKLRDKPVDCERGSHTGSDMDMSSDEDSNLCDRPATESATEWDGQDSQDPNNKEYWINVNLQAREAMRETTGTDASLSGDKYPDVVKEIARMRAWAEHDALPVEQRTGCEVPGCQCNGRVEDMDWGSEDMTETDDSEYEDPVDRDNRLYVESCNCDLSEGMTPRTYIPLPYEGTDAGGMKFGRNTKRTLRIQFVVLLMMDFSLMRSRLTMNKWFNRGRLLIMLTGQLGTGTITVDVGRGPEVKMTLPVMKILICSTDRSRSRRRQGSVLKRTASV